MMPLSTDTARTTLVIGGARSGKSRYAEQLLFAHDGTLIYIATAEAGDAEMAARIAEHQARRGAAWQTIEQPLDLVAALETHCRPTAAVLVDCLTLWLSNLMAASRDIAAETTRLVHAVPRLEGRAVLVSNEVGFGIVPNHPLGREFRDHAGRLNQAVAAAVDEAVFMVAGLPLRLKP
jgi:adenosylcobinamide kinase/adenosylcobinamide-phosphate guanylyltransferase